VKYIAMLSGGQDSTAMTLRLLELGEPVDYIVFCDTGLEHDEMYEYIDKLDAFFQRKYNIKITRLNPRKDFKHWVYGEILRGENEGKIRGVPSVLEMCYWRRESKERPFERWLKKMGIKEWKQYNGFVYGESKRYGLSPDHVLAPLIDWKWREEEVQQYLKSMEMENKLYQHFTRTGCAVCPKQSEASKYMIYKHYPKWWKYMKDMEEKLFKMNLASDTPQWHTELTTVQLEIKFKKKDKQQTFNLDFEPLADCFCKL